MVRILLCTFPFPAQVPPVEVASACEFCPNADPKVLDKHAYIPTHDRELEAAIRSFARWFFHPDEDQDGPAIEEFIRYAADLYTRRDHTGTCIPKTILFAYYKGLQFSGPEGVPRLSEDAPRR